MCVADIAQRSVDALALDSSRSGLKYSLIPISSQNHTPGYVQKSKTKEFSNPFFSEEIYYIRKTSKGLKRAFCPLKPLKLCFKAIKSLKIFKTRIFFKKNFNFCENYCI